MKNVARCDVSEVETMHRKMADTEQRPKYGLCLQAMRHAKSNEDGLIVLPGNGRVGFISMALVTGDDWERVVEEYAVAMGWGTSCGDFVQMFDLSGNCHLELRFIKLATGAVEEPHFVRIETLADVHSPAIDSIH